MENEENDFIHQIRSKNYCPFFNILAAVFSDAQSAPASYTILGGNSYFACKTVTIPLYAKSSLSHSKGGTQGRPLGCHYSQALIFTIRGNLLQ